MQVPFDHEQSAEPFYPLAAIFPLLLGEPFDARVESIKQNGLREPIWRHQDGRIVDGRNRWRACQEAGIECPSNTFVGSDEELLDFIIDRNLHRRHLDESQRAMAAARIATLRDGQRADRVAASIDAPSTQDEAAKLLNVSRPSVQRARAVINQAVPEVVKLVEDGKLAVSAAASVAKLPAEEQDELVARGKVEILAKAKEIRAEQQATKRTKRRATAETKAANAQPLPGERTYCVIYADPPWTFETYSELGKERSAENNYPTMPLRQVCDLPVSRCAADDAVLFLWATSPHLEQAFEVLKCWGFAYKSSLVWVKNRLATGYWARNRHEFLLIATRGDIPAPDPASVPDSEVEAAVGEHSAKPAIVRSIIERMTPGLSRIELFGRGEDSRRLAVLGFR